MVGGAALADQFVDRPREARDLSPEAGVVPAE